MKIKLLSLFLLTCFFSCDFVSNKSEKPIKPNNKNINHQGMIFINGGEFEMGGDNNQAMQDEFPKHTVLVNSFWMDETEVTNNQFRKFIDETRDI